MDNPFHIADIVRVKSIHGTPILGVVSNVKPFQINVVWFNNNYEQNFEIQFANKHFEKIS